MTKTVEVTLYQFDELNEKAKERASNNYCEHWMNHEWWDCTYDMMKEDGLKQGFNIKDIRFSGFWSQGDGASWAGAVNVKDWIMSKPTTYQEHPTTQIVLALIDEGWIDNIVPVTFSAGHYCHEYKMSIGDIEHYYRLEEDVVMQFGMFKGAQVGELIKIVDCAGGMLYDMSKEIEEDCRAFARTIYRELEADYYAQTTEEAIAEMYAINDVWFDETGAIA